MRGTRRLASYTLVPLAAVTLGGCARPASAPRTRAAAAPVVADTPSGTPADGSVTSMPDQPRLGVAYPFDLYSHCDIEFAQFAGRVWRAESPRTEPRRRPDAHGITTYDGYTPGTLTLVTDDTARFVADPARVDDAGGPIVFHPTSDRPPLCE